MHTRSLLDKATRRCAAEPKRSPCCSVTRTPSPHSRNGSPTRNRQGRRTPCGHRTAPPPQAPGLRQDTQRLARRPGRPRVAIRGARRASPMPRRPPRSSRRTRSSRPRRRPTPCRRSRPASAWAKALLDAIEKGTIPRADVPVGDRPADPRAQRQGRHGAAREGVGQDRARVEGAGSAHEEVEGASSPRYAREGRRGRTAGCCSPSTAPRATRCSARGRRVGPELTGSQRANLDYVLENVLDPSAVVPREFQIMNFTTHRRPRGRRASSCARRRTR